MQYRRIQLEVEAVFHTDGSFAPRRIYVEDKPYEIQKIMDVRSYCPRVVGCVAPVQYTVLVEGARKKIYYEADSNSWFSIKECDAAEQM